MQPSSIASERVFSILTNTFSSQQESSLEDYIQLSVILQYNYHQTLGLFDCASVFLKRNNRGFQKNNRSSKRIIGKYFKNIRIEIGIKKE